MTNAVAKAQSTTTPYTTTVTKRGAVSTAQTYHPGAMIAVNGTGYATKCDDTAGLRFDGLLADARPITVDSGGSNGDQLLNVEKCFLFTMKIASAAVTDVGRKVYAVYDNEVGFTSSAGILVGTVHAYVNATTVEIMPYWVSTSGVNAFDGETLTFTGATGVNVIVLPNTLADALTIGGAGTPLLTFNTTADTMLASVDLEFLDATDVVLGTGLDALLRWSTGDASDHSVVLALGDTSQMLHITDKAAVATDWAITSPTHPTLYLHSNTTPITDYLAIGTHDGTTCHYNNVGGTTHSFDVAGTAAATLSAAALTGGATCVGIFAAGVRTKQAVTNVHNTTPTAAELTTAFGDPATIGRGFIGTVDDADGDAIGYIVWASDASYYFIIGTKAT